jgi:eukaryotic-like serine/threonine-protein kinase
LPRLAWHAARAGERNEAATTYLAVADAARERHNFLEADLHYSRALDQIDAGQDDVQLRAFKGRGIMRYRLGRHDGSLVDLARAQELAVRSGDALAEADVLLDESMALDWLLEWRRSRELAERARELITAHPSPALEARVLLAVGRSCQRFNRDREAAELLREAARVAEQLGDEGYEVRVISDMMLGFLLPFLGLLDEAEERLNRAAALCEDKGDELHLSGILGNRSCLWIARNDRERFMEDLARYLAYGRRMGNAFFQSRGNLNAAYFLYWRGEFEAAIPYARQAIEIDERYFHQGGFRPDAAVLLARILWCAGDEAGACKLVDEVRAHQARARADGQNEVLLQPNDEMLLDMIALVLEKGGLAQWQPLMARAREVAQGQELIEALEVAGVAASVAGDAGAARKWWQEALQAGERIPNVMGERIRGRLSAIG